MTNKLLVQLAFTSVLAISGCATGQKACDKVAVADDAYGKVMKYLRETGLLETCDRTCAPGEVVCNDVKQAACKLKESVLKGQKAIYGAYQVCFEDSK